jgi:hypothetical protein
MREVVAPGVVEVEVGEGLGVGEAAEEEEVEVGDGEGVGEAAEEEEEVGAIEVVNDSGAGSGAGSGIAGVVVTTTFTFETVVDEQQPRDPNLTVPIPASAFTISGDFVLSFFFSASTTADGATLDLPRFVTLYCNEASLVPT